MTSQTNAIEQARRFIRILETMTPRQKVFLGELIEDMRAGRSTAKGEAKLSGIERQ